MKVRSDQTYRFDVPPATVWDAIGRVDDYRSWWPWLGQFKASGLNQGDQWRATVRPPLPYVLRFTVELVRIERGVAVDAVVDGDIEGEASIRLEADASGCSVRLVSSLAPHNGFLRGVTRVAPRLAHFGHDWVLATGFKQFRRRALPPAPGSH